jgi:hypothetical protein
MFVGEIQRRGSERRKEGLQMAGGTPAWEGATDMPSEIVRQLIVDGSKINLNKICEDYLKEKIN